MTIVRFIAKGDSESSKVITSITELPCPYNKMFEELAELAYKALNIDKIVFTLNEIKHVCPNIAKMSSNWNGLGLLKAVQYFNTEVGNVTFHFLHFSIQEYMAALYISTLSSNEQIKLLKSTFWEHRYYNTWILYVGITHGNSFALKHFLSGNRFQLTTKIFKSSRISNKFLKNKIRCLHLFQCFVESNNEDMIASVSHFLQGNKIDLSNQTLLPSDVDTLGFFLMRSVNKTWEMLDLSGCNIGSTGINILCDRFLNKKNHNVTIKAVDFSFNRMNYSTLVRLFELYKTWHTSEILLTDSEEILQNNTVNLYRIIEDAFSLYDNNIRVNLQFGSFLFAQQIDVVPLLLNVESIYLINCNWELPETVSKQSFHESIGHHRYNNIHIIDTSFAGYIMEIILCNFTNLHVNDTKVTSSIFVYNPALSNQDADRIWNVIDSILSYGVRLVISSYKVQGIIHTSSLNTELSRLKILNLIASVRALCSNTIQTYSWRQDLCCHGSESDLMIDTFIRILHKININNHLRDLKIAFREKYTLIAYNVIYHHIIKKALLTHLGHPIRAVYFNNCLIGREEYELLVNSAWAATLTSLYVYNCYLWLGCLTMLLNKLSCKEIFIHTLCDIDTDSLAVLVPKQENCSTLLVAKNMMFGYKPTSMQITVALQLDPSINALKLINYNGTSDTFNQIMRLIVSTSINWTEIDLSSCSTGEIKFYISNNNINKKAAGDTAFDLSYNNQPQEVNISNNYLQASSAITSANSLHDVTTLTKFCISNNNITKKAAGEIAVFISHYTQLQELYISNNDLEAAGAITLAKGLHNITKLTKVCISNNNLTEEAAGDIAIFVSHNTQLQELDVSNNHLEATGAVMLVKGLHHITTLTKFCISNNNITENAAGDIAVFISHNTQLQELDISNNHLQASGAIILAIGLHNITTLTKFYISNNNITKKAAGDIAFALSHNTQLQQLDVSYNNLQMAGAITLAKGLHDITTLTKFCISNNNITEEAAGDIAVFISHNTQLQELDISNNQLQVSGAITLAKGLHDITTLKIFCISNNNITEEAAGDIASLLHNNTQLKEVDIGFNEFKTGGIKIIAPALQHTKIFKYRK